MKQARLSRHGQNLWKLNGQEIEYLWVKENLFVPEQLINILDEENVEGVQIGIGMIMMVLE